VQRFVVRCILPHSIMMQLQWPINSKHEYRVVHHFDDLGREFTGWRLMFVMIIRCVILRSVQASFVRSGVLNHKQVSY